MKYTEKKNEYNEKIKGCEEDFRTPALACGRPNFS